ncbi:MAG: DUF5995 family protein [Polyangiaceae bacterium]
MESFGLRASRLQEPDLADALAQLDVILEDAKLAFAGGSFTRFYRQLAVRVSRELAAGQFEDASRIARLFSVVSSRYLHAIAAHRAGSDLLLSWDVALSFVREGKGSVLQEQLLGTNALLNIELGVSAAKVMRGHKFDALEADFRHLERIVLDHLEDFDSRRNPISPILQWFGFGMGKPKRWLLAESALRFHENAWGFGKRLSELDPAFWPAAIADRDTLASELAWKIAGPSIPTRVVLVGLRLFERPTERGPDGS